MTEKILLLGNQAIALGAVDAGISGVYAYPGTPSTEITEFIQEWPATKERSIFSRWCANEKTAMEAALGHSYAGKRALVCMKHVGLNVAADAFVNSTLTGANGGLVVVVADDPSMHSSQNEQDSRFYGKFSFAPVLEPSSQQEAYDMVAYGFELSERVKLPVLMRITTRMSHSRAVINTKPMLAQNELAPVETAIDWILLPVHARRKYAALLAAQPHLEELSKAQNIYTDGEDKSMGIIACGIGYNYVMESYPEGAPHPILKVTQYPIAKETIIKMASECDSLLIVEDGQPVVEEQIKGVLPSECQILGRLSGALPRVGELTPDNVRLALGFQVSESLAPSSVVMPRPPALCKGCGHRDVYDVLNETLREYEGYKIFGDIGCYTLGALPPFRAIHSCVDMGASITMAKGAADAGLYPAVAIIGDSTFTHSGMTGLLDAVNSDANITVVISDNLTTAMTGGQDSAGTGRIEQICMGIGVDPDHIKVVVPLAKNMEQIREILKAEIDHHGLSVIIPRRECIQTLKKNLKKKK